MPQILWPLLHLMCPKFTPIFLPVSRRLCFKDPGSNWSRNRLRFCFLVKAQHRVIPFCMMPCTFPSLTPCIPFILCSIQEQCWRSWMLFKRDVFFCQLKTYWSLIKEKKKMKLGKRKNSLKCFQVVSSKCLLKTLWKKRDFSMSNIDNRKTWKNMTVLVVKRHYSSARERIWTKTVQT